MPPVVGSIRSTSPPTVSPLRSWNVCQPGLLTCQEPPHPVVLMVITSGCGAPPHAARVTASASMATAEAAAITGRGERMQASIGRHALPAPSGEPGVLNVRPLLTTYIPIRHSRL